MEEKKRKEVSKQRQKTGTTRMERSRR